MNTKGVRNFQPRVLPWDRDEMKDKNSERVRERLSAFFHNSGVLTQGVALG
jgi:hypothetical protein